MLIRPKPRTGDLQQQPTMIGHTIRLKRRSVWDSQTSLPMHVHLPRRKRQNQVSTRVDLILCFVPSSEALRTLSHHLKHRLPRKEKASAARAAPQNLAFCRQLQMGRPSKSRHCFEVLSVAVLESHQYRRQFHRRLWRIVRMKLPTLALPSAPARCLVRVAMRLSCDRVT